MTTENNYMDMANKIFMMLDGYYYDAVNNNKQEHDMKNNNEQEPPLGSSVSETTIKNNESETVEQVLTDLIKMDNTGQDGGIMIDDLMDNMTGGDAKGKTTDKTTKQQDIISIQPKEINENYFEGGNADNFINNDLTDDENTADNLTDDELTDDYDEEYTMNDNEQVNNIYDDFLKHYTETTTDYNMFGGNNEPEPTKIKIISRFPYMIRY